MSNDIDRRKGTGLSTVLQAEDHVNSNIYITFFQLFFKLTLNEIFIITKLKFECYTLHFSY